MAAITPTRTKIDGGAQVIVWDQINQDDTGAAIQIPVGLKNWSFTFEGTWDSMVVTVEVSHISATAGFAPAQDAGGAALSATADEAMGCSSPGRWVRIAQTLGTTSDVNVALLAQP